MGGVEVGWDGVADGAKGGLSVGPHWALLLGQASPHCEGMCGEWDGEVAGASPGGGGIWNWREVGGCRPEREPGAREAAWSGEPVLMGWPMKQLIQ